MKLLLTLFDTARIRNISILLGFTILTYSPALAVPGATFRGSNALLYTKQAVSFGERPSGSKPLSAEREWIISQIRKTNAQISFDRFTAQTPDGPVPMVNVIARFPGTSGNAIAVTGHYDTKKIAGTKFVGANDGGSSTGLLLEFAHVAGTQAHRDDWLVVFFDGEEAVRDWTANDSCYGSRHLSAQWLADGTLKRLKALINVDMVGDANLSLLDDENSSPALREKLRTVAINLGHKDALGVQTAMDDDHRPFAELGVNVIDLIDFNYGPQNSYWHSAQDTVDKLSAQSLQIVGDLTLGLVRELDGSAGK